MRGRGSSWEATTAKAAIQVPNRRTVGLPGCCRPAAKFFVARPMANPASALSERWFSFAILLMALAAGARAQLEPEGASDAIGLIKRQFLRAIEVGGGMDRNSGFTGLTCSRLGSYHEIAKGYVDQLKSRQPEINTNDLEKWLYETRCSTRCDPRSPDPNSPCPSS